MFSYCNTFRSGPIIFRREISGELRIEHDTGKAGDLLARAAVEELEVQVKPLDVTRSDTFASFVETVAEEHDRLYVLINNAGVHRSGALEDLREETFRLVMETNCIGPVLLTRAVLPLMRDQNRGLIIMMS